MVTQSLTQIIISTKRQFGNDLPDSGLGNRRKIAGTNTWSQHAYENAWDIGLYGPKKQANVVEWLQEQKASGKLPINNILHAGNRPNDHYDHIHVDASPKQTGTPGKVTTWNAKGIKANSVVKDVNNNRNSQDRNSDQTTEDVDGAGGLFGLPSVSGIMENVNELAFRAAFGLIGLAAIGFALVLIVKDTKAVQAATNVATGGATGIAKGIANAGK